MAWDINPSGHRGDEHTDEALTGVYSSNIDLINSERETIWNRYNIMLVVNTFILGFVARTPPPNPTGWDIVESVASILFGFAMSVLWLDMTVAGWKAYEDLQEDTAEFLWPPLHFTLNPFMILERMEFYGLRKRRIYNDARWVIRAFMIMYIYWAVKVVLIIGKVF